MEQNFLNIEAKHYSDDEFSAFAPIGNKPILTKEVVDCEMCCPGKCTGCTSCNSCNLLF